MKQQGLFENYKYCEFCKKPLPLDQESTLCPACQETMLFQEVKEYIRANDVTEYDVASHFNLPLQQVKQWIREGRIEYKDSHLNTISMCCIKCGAPISFGQLCPKCLKQMNMAGHSSGSPLEDSRMRYFGKDS